MGNQKRLAGSVLAALLAEIANKIFPLIVIRHAQEQLGMSAFGMAQFAILLVDVASPFLAWGYLDKGAMDASAHGKDSLSRVFSKIVLLRLIHFLFILCCFYPLVRVVPDFSVYVPIVNLLVGFFFLSCFDCVHLLQGQQRMHVLSAVSILAKTLGLLGVFLFVNSEADAGMFAICAFGINGIISLMTFIYAKRAFSLKFEFTDLKLTVYFRSTAVFAGSFLVLFLNEKFDLFWVESLFDVESVGLYSGPLRLQQAITPFVYSIGAVFFSEMISSQSREIERYVKYGLWVVLSLAFPILVGSFFTSDFLVISILGDGFQKGAHLLPAMLLGTVGYCLIFVFGRQVLLIYQKVGVYLAAISIVIPLSGVVVFSYSVQYGLFGVALTISLIKLAVGLLLAAIANAHLNYLPYESVLRPLAAALLMGAGLWLMGDKPQWQLLLMGVPLYGVFFALMNRSMIAVVWSKLRESSASSPA